MDDIREDFPLNATRSPNDAKSYRLFTIPSNQLQCLLVVGPGIPSNKKVDLDPNGKGGVNEMRRRPTAGGYRRKSHARPNFAQDFTARSRESVDFDFLQTVDIDELEKNGVFKRSKSMSVAASRRSKSMSAKSGRKSNKANAKGGDAKGGIRQRIASSFARKSQASASGGSEASDPDDYDDDLDAIAAAAAASAMSVDPTTRRKTLNWSSSRAILLGPDTKTSNADDTLSGPNGAAPLAAVCLSVGVGSFSDPEEHNGLAHFLEHMLSMGTDQYPEEQAFDAFITKNGGLYNANTNTEEMNFYFEVREEALEQALDMFSRFFIAPLISPSAAKREIKAVQSELAMFLNDDDFRIAQVWRHTSRPGTPYVNFNIGSEDTLGSLLQDIEPMKQFFEKHFVGSNMKLAIFAPNWMDTDATVESTASKLQQVLVDKFSSVRGSPTGGSRNPTTAESPAISFASCGLPWVPAGTPLANIPQSDEMDPDAFGGAVGCVYRIVAQHSGTHRLRFAFPLGPKQSMHDEDVHYHVGYIIGHESKGGILAELKAKGWATFLAAGVVDGGQVSTTGFRCFLIQILLTPLGLREWVQVVGLVFQFIGQVLVKAGPMKKYFEEYHAVQKTAHEYYEEPSPVELVKYCSSYLLPRYRVPNSQLLRARLNTKWQPTAIKEFCRALVPENMRLDICSRHFKRYLKKNPRMGSFPAEKPPVDGSSSLLASEFASVSTATSGPSQRSMNKKKSKAQIGSADHLPNSELSSRAPIMEPISSTPYWVDQIPSSMMETFKLMYSGKVKLYLRNQVGHDTNTPGLAMPPYNQFVSRSLSIVPFTAKPVTASMLQVLENPGSTNVGGASSGPEGVADQTGTLMQLMWGPKNRVIGFDASQSTVLVSFKDGEKGIAHRWRSANNSAVSALAALYKIASKLSRRRSSGRARSSSRSSKNFDLTALYPIELKPVESNNTTWQHQEEETDGKLRLVHAPALVSEEEQDDAMRVWMMQDQKHKVPFVGAHVQVIAPRGMGSLQNAVLLDLYVNLVKEWLHSELFLAQEAGLVVEIENNDYGILMKFEGISASIPMIVEKCISSLVSYGERLAWNPPSALEFQTALETTILSYSFDRNQSKQSISSLDRTEVHGSLRQMLLTRNYAPHAKADFLRRRKVQFKEFAKFAQVALRTCFAEVLFYGNVDYAGIRTSADNILEILRSNKVSPVSRLPKAYPVIAPECSPGAFSGLMQLGVSQATGQSLVMHFQLGPESRQLRLLTKLLYQVIDQPLFHQVRTVEQVGYSISCSHVEYLGMLGFGVQVVSDTHTPGQCMESVERFLTSFQTMLMDMPQDDFEMNKNAVKEQILGHDSSTKATKAAALRCWKMIKGDAYDWDIVRKDVAALDSVTKEMLLELYNRLIFPSSPKRRRVTVIVTGHRSPGLRELFASMTFNPKVSLMNGTEPMYCSSLKKLGRGRKKDQQQKKWLAQRAAARKSQPAMPPPQSA